MIRSLEWKRNIFLKLSQRHPGVALVKVSTMYEDSHCEFCVASDERISSVFNVSFPDEDLDACLFFIHNSSFGDRNAVEYASAAESSGSLFRIPVLEQDGFELGGRVAWQAPLESLQDTSCEECLLLIKWFDSLTSNFCKTLSCSHRVIETKLSWCISG